MRVALFGGTFDPVHCGHLAVARSAAERFRLAVVYFVPADVPPHKRNRQLTDFQHRFAMLALATAEDKRFIPSLLDAPSGRPNYSIETVRKLKSQLNKSDRLYYLIGMDAFKDIGTWHQAEQLLAECEFIVASRPGFSLAEVGRALPESLRPKEEILKALAKQHPSGTIALPGATIHLLPEVAERVSSTQVRAAAKKSVNQLARHVPRLVAEYIKKEHLYLDEARPKPEPAETARVLSFSAGRHKKSRSH
jgi:nicotinate-nucleotide adenylyltransferase